ncbi:tellurite resistance TerB family protein [Nocardia sp. NBC_01388]|uniref:tellurite resistance TerB family protein n=1 Tax=Nocardia sp. NBC_01388 TaxID=2903596 RepID=UPI00324A2C16
MVFHSRLEQAPQWRQQLLAQRNELRGGSFRDATMGICALIAAADGAIDPAGRTRVAQLIGADTALQHFPTDELRNLFEDNCTRITLDPAFGRAYVMAQIAEATGNAVEARAAVQLGIMIGKVGGDLDAQKIAAVRDVCRALRLDPQEFGL